MSNEVRHYLLRLWREGKGREEGEGRDEGEGAWRASLRSVRDGSLLTFSDPEALMKYLDEAKGPESQQAQS